MKKYLFLLALAALFPACGAKYPLHQAVKDYDTAKIVDLIRGHADVNARDNKGNTPLHYATVSRGMTELLLRSGANPNLTNDDGETPLHFASYGSEIGAIDELLSNGADPGIADRNGDTPLHFAVSWDDEYAAKALLAYGAKTGVTNRLGMTPLDIAAANGNFVLVGLLTNAEKHVRPASGS